MPSESTPTIERAQLLLREIGPDRIQQYIEQRLAVGTELSTRHLLVRAYAQLTGQTSGELLLQIALGKGETSATRSAAIAALADLFERWEEADQKRAVISTWITALGDISQEVRSAAASALTRHEIDEAVPLLDDLVDKDLLDPVVEEATRQYVRQSRALAVGQIIPDVEDFLIRGRDLASLNELLSSHFVPQLCITGMAGVGKTTLAAYYARQSDHTFKFWLSGFRHRDLADSALDMLRQAYLQGLTVKGSTASKLDVFSTPFDWYAIRNELIRLLSDESALLVIDDLDSSRHPEELTQFVSSLSDSLPRLQCLLTSRRVLRQTNWRIFELKALTATQAKEFLFKILLERNLTVEPSSVQRLLEVSQGSPLLLKLAVEYVSRGEDLPTATRRELGPEFLQAVIGSGFARLNSQQRRLLEILCQFEPADHKPNDPELNAVLESEHINQPQLLELLETLSEEGLVLLRADGSFSFAHLLVKEYVRQKVSSRTTLRVNRQLAGYYENEGELLRAARHYVAASDYRSVVGIVADSLTSIINQGHASEALQILSDAEPHIRKDESRVKLRLLTTKGYLSSLLGNPDESLAAYKEVQALGAELGDQSIEAAALLNLANEYSRKGQYDRATELSQQSLRLFIAIGDELGIDRAKLGLAEISVRLGRWDEAIELYSRVLATREAVDYESGAAEIYSNLGLVHYNRGELEQALEMYQRSLAAFDRTGDVRSEAQVYNNLGLVYADMGQVEQALKAYEHGLALSQRIEDVAAVARTYHNLGSLYVTRGEPDRAVEMYQRSLATKQGLGDVQGTAQVLGNLGGAYARKGEMDRAVETYNRSSDLFAALGDVRGVATSQANLGSAYHTMGDEDRAEQFLLRSLQLFEEQGDVLNYASACVNLGSVYASLGLVEKAVGCFARAYSILIRIDHPNAKIAFESLITVLGSQRLAQDFLQTYVVEAQDYQASITGIGTIAQTDSVAAGERSVVVVVNTSESVIQMGDANIVGSYLPRAENSKRISVLRDRLTSLYKLRASMGVDVPPHVLVEIDSLESELKQLTRPASALGIA